MVSPVIESACTAGEVFNPWVGKTPWRRHGNPLQHSCLENLMDRGVWWATVHRVTKRCSRLKQLNTHTHTHTHTQANMSDEH